MPKRVLPVGFRICIGGRFEVPPKAECSTYLSSLLSSVSLSAALIRSHCYLARNFILRASDVCVELHEERLDRLRQSEVGVLARRHRAQEAEAEIAPHDDGVHRLTVSPESFRLNGELRAHAKRDLRLMP